MSSDHEVVDEEECGDGDNWIEYYCGLPGHEFFCEVDRGFIEDNFNMFGLKLYFPDSYAAALALILDRADASMESATLDKEGAELYGLIHARFILTVQGLEVMRRKYAGGEDSQGAEFGVCPRMNCANTPVLPVGLDDEPYLSTVKLYCPCCREVYNSQSYHSHIDSAAFGTTFPHLFFLTYPELLPTSGPGQYVPRVFGFKVHPSAYVTEQQGKEEDSAGLENACASDIGGPVDAAAGGAGCGSSPTGNAAPAVRPRAGGGIAGLASVRTQPPASSEKAPRPAPVTGGLPRVEVPDSEPRQQAMRRQQQQWEADASSMASPFESPWASSLAVTPTPNGNPARGRPGVNRAPRAAPNELHIAADGTVMPVRDFFHSPGSAGDLSHSLLGGRCDVCSRPCLVTDSVCLACSHADRSQSDSKGTSGPVSEEARKRSRNA